MTAVGIIANPVSGKDIRRLVAHGSVFDNQEKVRIVRRLLTGLEATGVRKVIYMPDAYAIVPRAADGLSVDISMDPLAMRIRNDQRDSETAGRLLSELGAGALIVLGGDGTSRAVAKGNRTVPMLPLSTGTNNVFPYMIESTIGGLAAGLVGTGRVPQTEGGFRSCRLEVMKGEKIIDIALVDVAVYNDRFLASRAIWEMDKVSQIFLTRARPDAIGLSAIGGQITTIRPQEPHGLHLFLGNGGWGTVVAAVGPGLIQTIGIQSEAAMNIGDTLPVEKAPCVLALDGEREVEVKKAGSVRVRLSDRGPLVIDPVQTMSFAQANGLMTRMRLGGRHV